MAGAKSLGTLEYDPLGGWSLKMIIEPKPVPKFRSPDFASEENAPNVRPEQPSRSHIRSAWGDSLTHFRASRLPVGV